MIGFIKTIRADKGYFFVRGQDDVEYFAHVSALDERFTIDDLAVGDEVELEVDAKAPRGPRAKYVLLREKEAVS